MLGEGWGEWRSSNHLPAPPPEGVSAVGSACREKKKEGQVIKKKRTLQITCITYLLFIHILLLEHDGHGLVGTVVMVGLDGLFHP